ncbi:glycolate oxidase subunit GlcF, partial [Pseudomonas syringae]|uniref:glycolate oxidase subunit GlcF n=1 Tax=Pseudomonas syringae TaxID=317 RepID=UPI001F168BDA
IGRAAVEDLAPRPIAARMLREGLRRVIPHPGLFKSLTGMVLKFRPLLPQPLASKLPTTVHPAGLRPHTGHARQVLLLEGCVQPGLSPNTNSATARVLDRLGIGITAVSQAGCCGAVDYHLNAQQAGLDRARRNIDAWWPALQGGAESLIQTASGCGAFVKDYGHLLRHDPGYADKAEQISARTKDLVELLRDEPLETLGIKAETRLAFHCPCTLQHAQNLGGEVERVLTRLGFNLTTVADGHLCCGSAGTYSITQPAIARQLRDNRMNALESGKPQVIATANIGCQTHLASAGRTPVRHWIELIDAALGTPESH